MPGEWFGQARWLARQDIRRAWLSYPASGLFVLFLGFVATSLVWGVQTQEVNGARNLGQAVFFADYVFVLTGCILVVNAISMDYLRVWTQDVFSDRTAFLRSLPLSTGTLVASRVITMLFAVPFTASAFFVPVFLFTDLRELGLSYLWFCGIWLGWGLLYAGVTLLCEFGLSGRTYCWFSLVLIAGLVAGLLLIENVSGVGLVGSAASLAQAGYGPLLAPVSLVVGGIGFVLFARLTVRRIEHRELSS